MNYRERYGGVSEVRRAAVHRMDDAQAAYEKKRWRACMYLAGYAVECRLKVALMKKHDCDNLTELADILAAKGAIGDARDLFTHSLERLLNLTGRADALRANPAAVEHYTEVNRWTPTWRYNPDLSNPDDAKDFLDAARALAHWIDVNT